MTQLVGPNAHGNQQQRQVPLPNQVKQPPKAQNKSVILFPSDKNGCGFYRTFIPFSYLTSKHGFDCPSLFSFNFDLNFIVSASWLRFQRQVTNKQLKVAKEYKKVIKSTGSPAKLAYELDDLVHGIEPSNILAFQFYTESRKKNLIEFFNLVDTITFSTQFLKSFYEEKFNIKNSVVIPNYLPKYMWADKGKRNKANKGKKPRILWAGSASHVGKGGDLEFLIPLMKKTKNEFEWVFFGVIPPELTGKFEYHDWADFYSYPAALDSIDADIAICPVKDNIFNYAKSDLKMLEYTAIGIPSIFSSIGSGQGPYDLVDGINCVENKEELWYDAIKQMVNDESVRNKFFTKQKEELNRRWLEDDKNISKYIQTYK